MRHYAKKSSFSRSTNWKDERQLNEAELTEIKQKKAQYTKSYTAMTITATVLCIISAIPLLCGVFFTQLLNGSQLDQLMTGLLLQTDDYIPKKKLGRKIMNKYATL